MKKGGYTSIGNNSKIEVDKKMLKVDQCDMLSTETIPSHEIYINLLLNKKNNWKWDFQNWHLKYI